MRGRAAAKPPVRAADSCGRRERVSEPTRLCADCGVAPAPVGQGTRCPACRSKRIVERERQRYAEDPAFRARVSDRKRAQFGRRMDDPEKVEAHRARSREAMRRMRERNRDEPSD